MRLIAPTRPRRLIAPVCFLLLLSFVGLAPAGAAAQEPSASSDCVPGQDGCIPSPEQCATGEFNGAWQGGGRTAVCAGGAGQVASYAGGDPSLPCGAVIEANVLVTGSWTAPHRCPRSDVQPKPGGPGSLFEPSVRSRDGMVVSTSQQASDVGAAILRRGGNAMDAAVATAFALGVTRPDMAGIGGGGSLLYRPSRGRVAALDFFPQWPAAVTPENFTPDNELGGFGVMPPYTGRRVVGVPGTVAGLAEAMRRFGSLRLADVIGPAERLAREGIVVNGWLADGYAAGVCPGDVACTDTVAPTMGGTARLRLFPASAETYLVAGALPPPPGHRLVQDDLATSLALIARDGPRAFYRGAIADRIVAEMERPALYPGDEALLTRRDLETYRVRWAAPVSTRYRGKTVYGLPAPSVGGIMTAEILNILEPYRLRSTGHSSADHIHLFAEASKLARADADRYVGDPRFVNVPTSTLVSKEWAAKRRGRISRAEARDATAGEMRGQGPRPDGPPGREPGNTAHISVVDRRGNAASLTFTVGAQFGSAVVAPGTGFALNEVCCGDPGTVNAPIGGRVTRHPVTATIVVDRGQPILVAGAAGGSRIQLGTIWTMLNVLEFGMDLGLAVDVARAQERYCCTLELERWRVSGEVIAELEERGHSIADFGEYAGVYTGVPVRVELAGVDLRSAMRVGAADPRNERGVGVP